MNCRCIKYSVADDYATQAYVSPTGAQVAVYTTRQSRLLAWLGTIPHWFYFADLRANQPLWYDIVVWTSGIGCVLALLGLVMSFTQWRKVRPFKLGQGDPLSEADALALYSGHRIWCFCTDLVL